MPAAAARRRAAARRAWTVGPSLAVAAEGLSRSVLSARALARREVVKCSRIRACVRASSAVALIHSLIAHALAWSLQQLSVAHVLFTRSI